MNAPSCLRLAFRLFTAPEKGAELTTGFFPFKARPTAESMLVAAGLPFYGGLRKKIRNNRGITNLTKPSGV
jgi:hypothetical protein